MPRHARNRPQEMGPHATQQFPATELAAAAGLYPSDRNSFDYTQTLRLKETLTDICKHCAIRFGLPDQSRKHLGDAIGLPNEPVLRYPHREIPMDPRWEALANALRFPAPGDFPLVQLEVFNAAELQSLKESLPSLVEDLGLRRQSRHEPQTKPLFSPITREWGDKLVDKIEKVRTYGDNSDPNDDYNRAIARNMHRQMRIYIALGPEWTLVNTLESLALYSCAGINPVSKHSEESSRELKPSTPPLHASRRNLTGKEPAESPSSLPGLRWMWVRHESSLLPRSWGPPVSAHWGRFEPQFPNTARPNTSLFGHSARYMDLNLEGYASRDEATRSFLEALQEARKQYETLCENAKTDGRLTKLFKDTLKARLFKTQDELLDSYILKTTRK